MNASAQVPNDIEGLTILSTVQQFKKEKKEAQNGVWLDQSGNQDQLNEFEVQEPEDVSVIQNYRRISHESNAIDEAWRSLKEDRFSLIQHSRCEDSLARRNRF